MLAPDFADAQHAIASLQATGKIILLPFCWKYPPTRGVLSQSMCIGSRFLLFRSRS